MQLVAAGDARLDELDEARAGLGVQVDVRRGGERVVVRHRLGGRARADHADPAGAAWPRPRAGWRGGSPRRRDVVALAGVAQHRGAGGVAGDDQRLDARGRRGGRGTRGRTRGPRRSASGRRAGARCRRGRATDSCGSWSMTERATVSPPKPESKMPIGASTSRGQSCCTTRRLGAGCATRHADATEITSRADVACAHALPRAALAALLALRSLLVAPAPPPPPRRPAPRAGRRRDHPVVRDLGRRAQPRRHPPARPRRDADAPPPRRRGRRRRSTPAPRSS